METDSLNLLDLLDYLHRTSSFFCAYHMKRFHIIRCCFQTNINKTRNADVLDKYNQLLLNEIVKAAPDESKFFLTGVIFLDLLKEQQLHP